MPIWIGGGSSLARRSSGPIVWSGEFEAVGKEEGAASRAGKAAAAVFGTGAGVGRATIVTRNPTSVRAARPKLAPRKIGRTRERRDLGARPSGFSTTGFVAGGSRRGSFGGGRAFCQVGYGFCPANRTRPS